MVQALKEKDVSLYQELGSNSFNFNYYLLNEKKLSLKSQEFLEFIYNNPHFINVKEVTLENPNSVIFKQLFNSDYVYSLQSIKITGKKIDLKAEDICRIFDHNS